MFYPEIVRAARRANGQDISGIYQLWLANKQQTSSMNIITDRFLLLHLQVRRVLCGGAEACGCCANRL